MTEQLEVIRGFCLKSGTDVKPGDRINVAEVGEARAAQLCSGSSPKCRPAPAAPPARAAAPPPADSGPRTPPSTPEPRARVPGALRNR